MKVCVCERNIFFKVLAVYFKEISIDINACEIELESN